MAARCKQVNAPLKTEKTRQKTDRLVFFVMTSDSDKVSKGELARIRILDTAMDMIRETGFGAMRIDDLCKRAGITKGGFFHHFSSKAELGEAAAHHWSTTTTAFFEAAPYHEPADPLDRILAYIDFRQAIMEGNTAEFTCVAGTLAQEVHQSSPAICDAAWQSMSGHAATLVDDIAEAAALHAPDARIDAESLALYTQAALQGAFVLAKGKNDVAIAREMVTHLRRYVELLFGMTPGSGGLK